ncbi:acyl carrier protein [Rheinheimera sp. MMS21-TC3]|uniref:acyl carrier protein n=1 Tax=Rheinheimera sp. MMS21-TC3 TaxID=3072790 RepID=UPI0028C456E8|nr:acyl carrier protein [Rheinheimera sp. MMS21-TC3]WNO59521.1 acyl carrier protein [Rheinheimera sp. MMS21-TC3]
MDRNLLTEKLKQLLVIECDKEDELEWQEIANEEVLFGNKSRLDLDSLDALQLSLAVQKQYGIRIEGASQGRKVLYNIDSLADYILANT